MCTTIVSQNVRGLRDNRKRERIYKRLKSKGGIIFLQETHSTELDCETWDKMWDGDIFFSHGENRSKGVMIMIRKSLNFIVKDEMKDNDGRIIIVRGMLNDQNIVLCNLYAPNEEKLHMNFLILFKKMLSEFTKFEDEMYVIGGDFNFVCDIGMDRMGGNPHVWSGSVNVWDSWCELFDLIDIWRVKNPNEKVYTWRK